MEKRNIMVDKEQSNTVGWRSRGVVRGVKESTSLRPHFERHQMASKDDDEFFMKIKILF